MKRRRESKDSSSLAFSFLDIDSHAVIRNHTEKSHMPFTQFSAMVTSFISAVHTTSLLFLTEDSKNKQIKRKKFKVSYQIDNLIMSIDPHFITNLW